MLGANLKEKDRKRSTVADDFIAHLESEIFSLMEQARRDLARAFEADAESKGDGDPVFGRGAASSFQSPGRGRGLGRGSAFGHHGGHGHFRQRSRAPPRGDLGFRADRFRANQFPDGHGRRPHFRANFPHRGLGKHVPPPPRNYSPRLQANVHLRPNGRGQCQARRQCQVFYRFPLKGPRPISFISA